MAGLVITAIAVGDIATDIILGIITAMVITQGIITAIHRVIVITATATTIPTIITTEDPEGFIFIGETNRQFFLK